MAKSTAQRVPEPAPPPTMNDRIEDLRSRAANLEAERQRVAARLAELDATEAEAEEARIAALVAGKPAPDAPDTTDERRRLAIQSGALAKAEAALIEESKSLASGVWQPLTDNTRRLRGRAAHLTATPTAALAEALRSLAEVLGTPIVDALVSHMQRADMLPLPVTGPTIDREPIRDVMARASLAYNAMKGAPLLFGERGYIGFAEGAESFLRNAKIETGSAVAAVDSLRRAVANDEQVAKHLRIADQLVLIDQKMNALRRQEAEGIAGEVTRK